MRRVVEDIVLGITGILAAILMCLLMALCRIAGLSWEG